MLPGGTPPTPAVWWFMMGATAGQCVCTQVFDQEAKWRDLLHTGEQT